MELAAILVIPCSPAGFLCRRWPPFRRADHAGRSGVVFVLAVEWRGRGARTGRVDALGGWLTCDGLGALVLLLVALVGVTAALFSWGYIRHRSGHGGRGKSSTITGSTISSSCLARRAGAGQRRPDVDRGRAHDTALRLSGGLRGHAGSARGGMEIRRARPRWGGSRAARLSHSLLGIAGRGLRAVYLGRAGRGGAANAAGALVAGVPPYPRGFGTKVGLVPMHTWLPDAHSQAPASICALLSGVETTTVLYVILRLFPVIGGAPASMRGRGSSASACCRSPSPPFSSSMSAISSGCSPSRRSSTWESSSSPRGSAAPRRISAPPIR